MWDHVFLWTGRYIYYCCMVKFSDQFSSFPESDWLTDWWKKFGLNSSAIHPDVIDTAMMFLFPHGNFPNIVYNLEQIYENEYKMIFIREKHAWVIRTWYIL